MCAIHSGAKLPTLRFSTTEYDEFLQTGKPVFPFIEVLHKLGISPTEAIRIFYRQISLRGGLPFPVEIPNALTAATLEKSRRGEDVTEYGTLDELFESWEK